MGDRAKKKNLCRVIRLYAQHKLQGTPVEEIWGEIQKGSDIDYRSIFNEFREDTIKKISQLLDANDHTRQIPRATRMSSSNWLMYDLVLVHEDINVIGSENGEEIPHALKILIFLVKKHNIEQKGADTVFDAWLNLYVDYNGDGRYCSPMLLQKRWYQIKASTRNAFYSFWYNYHKNLDTAKEKPGALHIFVAKQFPTIITKPFVDWKKLYEKKMIMVLEQIDKVMGPSKHQADTDDVVLVEPTIEVIDITDPEEEKVTNKETEQLGLGNDKQEQLNATDANKAPAITEEVNITIIDHELYTGGDDDDDDGHIPNTHEVKTNIERAPSPQEVINSIESKLNGKKESEHLPLEASKSTILVPVNVDVDEIANTNENKKNIETPLQEVIDFTECNLTDQKGIESLSQKTINSTIHIPESRTPQDSNLEDDDVIEILPETIKTEEIREVDGLCNVKIIDATHIDQDFQDRDKSLTVSTFSNSMEETGGNVCDIDKGSQKLDYNNDICMSQLEIVDDGIEFDEDDIILLNNNEPPGHSSIDLQESHDDCTQEGLLERIDSKLIMLPIVYTTKIDNIPLLKDTSLINLNIKYIVNNIIRQSKPKFKQIKGLIKSECIDINDITKHETLKAMSPVPDNLNYCKYIKRLLKTPRKRSYNPVLLCKNPDFNTRLRRLSAGFLSIVRNCKLLKTLKPLTIDLNKAFEHELVNGTLYVPKGVDVIGSNANTTNHTSSALLPTAMHVQSLIDNSQPFSEDRYSSGLTYKVPNINKNTLTIVAEKECNNITLLQYNSATTQVEKEVSFDESEKESPLIKQAPTISDINSSAVDIVLDNYLNNLNKNSFDRNVTDVQTTDDPMASHDNEVLAQLPENNITNDTNDFALINPIQENIIDIQTTDDPMAGNDNEVLAELPENNITKDTVSNDVPNMKNNDPMECDNNKQNIISNDVEQQCVDEIVAAKEVITTGNSTKKHDKKEKNKSKGKHLKKSNNSTPWYVHVPKKLNFLGEDSLLTECSLKRMLTALNAVECTNIEELQTIPIISKSKRTRTRASRAKPKRISGTESKQAFCCWIKMTNSQPDCQKNDLVLHPCGTDFSKCTCCCKYSHVTDNSDKDQQITKSKEEETTTSVNNLLTEYKADDINSNATKAKCKTVINHPKTPEKHVRLNNTLLCVPATTENVETSEYISNINHCHSNISLSKINSNNVGNISIDSNNGMISIDGSTFINTSPDRATLVKNSPHFNANPEINTTESIKNNIALDSNTNLFIIKPLLEKCPIKLSDDKILLTTMNFDDYELTKKVPNRVENKEKAHIISYSGNNLKPGHDEVEVTADLIVTENNDVSLTPIIEDPNNISKETSLINEISDINSCDISTAEYTNAKGDAESESDTIIENVGVKENQNEVGATIECISETVSNLENDKKSILSDLMEMAGISVADTSYDNAIVEPTQTENITDSVPMLNVPTLSPVTSLEQLKWAVSHNAKFYSLNIKTGGLVSIAIEMIKKCDSVPIIVSDDDVDDDHNYFLNNRQKNIKRFYVQNHKDLPMKKRPGLIRRRIVKKLVSVESTKERIPENNVIDIDSSDEDKIRKDEVIQRPRKRYNATKIIKSIDYEKVRNATRGTTSLKQTNQRTKQIFTITKIIKPVNMQTLLNPSSDSANLKDNVTEIAEILLKPQRARKCSMNDNTKNVEVEDSSDDEPLSKKARVNTPVSIDVDSPMSSLPVNYEEESHSSNVENLEPEISIDIILQPESDVVDDDFILGV